MHHVVLKTALFNMYESKIKIGTSLTIEKRYAEDLLRTFRNWKNLLNYSSAKILITLASSLDSSKSAHSSNLPIFSQFKQCLCELGNI